MRQFRDQAGVEWRVFLTARGSDAVSREYALPEEFREGWLVFESANQKRRLAPVPPDWESLPAEALAALCAKASPQLTRTKPLGEAKVGPPPERLRPRLREAEQQLDHTLEEVCDTANASKLDTGELIRIEENLALATEAAKEAVSLRRKIRADEERSHGPDGSPKRAREGDDSARTGGDSR